PRLCLLVLESGRVGRDDRRWAWVNMLLHLAVVLALLWAGAALAPGNWRRRQVTGTLAALLFSAPVAADPAIEKWIVGWWPCQSEILSLLFGLLLLGTVATYCRTGRRVWAGVSVAAFVLAVG